MVTFFRHSDKESTFDPEAHEYLVCLNGLYLFPMKETDRPSSMGSHLDAFIPIRPEDVPLKVRRRAYARLGGFARHGGLEKSRC